MSIFNSIFKASANLAAAPVALAVDIITLPKSAVDLDGPFDRTAKCLKRAAKAAEDTLEGR